MDDPSLAEEPSDGAGGPDASHDDWLDRVLVRGLELDQLGVDETFVNDCSEMLLGQSGPGPVREQLNLLRYDVIRRAVDAWGIHHGRPAAEDTENLSKVAEDLWTELASSVARRVLSGGRVDRSAIDIANALLAHAIRPSARSLAEIEVTEPLPNDWELFGALDALVDAVVAAVVDARDAAQFGLGVIAANLYVAAVKQNNSFQFYLPSHHALGRIYQALEHAPEAADLKPLLDHFGDYVAVGAAAGAAATPVAALQLPTVRNMIVHLNVQKGLDHSSLESVGDALDTMESSCGSCLGVDDCREQESGCGEGKGQAESCRWLLGTYVDCLHAYWELVRAPEPLDHALAIAEGRLSSDTPLLLWLRRSRYSAYRRAVDRDALRQAFLTDDYSPIPVPLLRWLLDSLPVDAEMGTAPIFQMLSLDTDRMFDALSRLVADGSVELTVTQRLRLCMDIAQVAVQVGKPDVAMTVLDVHWQRFDEFYRLSGLLAGSATLVASRRDATPLHAGLMAEAGRLSDAVERLEIDRVNNLRDDVTMLGYRSRDAEVNPELAADLVVLHRQQVEMDRLSRTASSPLGEGERIARRITLRREMDVVRSRIASFATMPTYRNPAALRDVQDRSARAGCPVVYLWSTDQGSHLLIVDGHNELKYVALQYLTKDLLQPAVENLRTALAGYRTAPSWTRQLAAGELAGDLIRDTFALGLGEAVAVNVAGPRLLIVPVGSWHAVPLHLASHQDVYADAALPVISYAATGVATAARRDRGPLTGRPSLVLSDLTHTSAPLRWARAEGRMVSTSLGSNAVLLAGDAASGPGVITDFLDGHPDCGVVHIGGHGAQRSDGRLSSAGALPFDSGAVFGTSHLMNDLRSRSPDLWFFSACDSGGIADSFFDEMDSLQGTALVAGAGDVMVTQWPVKDFAAALYAASFYERLAEGRACWQAAFESREWLMNLTQAEAVGYLRSRGEDVPDDVPDGPSLCFPDTWSWAPFAHYQGW